MAPTEIPRTGRAGRTTPPRRVLSARTGVAVAFILNGLAVGAWFARVPATRDALDLTAGQLGLLLLAISGGSMLALPTAGLVTDRLGPARTVSTATVLIAAGLTTAGTAASLTGSVPLVAMALFALGYGLGASDVALNVEAAAVERRLGRTIMPRFHAGWSLGSVLGAALGAGAAQVALPIGVNLTLVAVVVLAGTLLAVPHFLLSSRSMSSRQPEGDATGPVPETAPRSAPVAGQPSAPAPEPAGKRGGGLGAAWREPRTLLIGALVLIMAFTEGSANDWIAIAFIDGYGMSEAAGAGVFGVFVVGMTVGRTAGTLALDRWGRVPVLLATILLAVAGAALAVLAGNGWLAVVGVACWGVGASLGFPVGMSAAADDEDRAAARVSVVAAIAYTAFLAGPPLLGFLGDRIGILRALMVVPLLLLPALALVPAVRPLPGHRTVPER